MPSRRKKTTKFANMLSAVHGLRESVDAPPILSKRALAVERGRSVMNMTTVVFVTIFTETHFQTLPHLRANIEQVGSWFKKFSLVIGSPGNETHIAKLAGTDAWKLDHMGLGGDASRRTSHPGIARSVDELAIKTGTEQNDAKSLLDIYLRAWQDEAAQGRLARPLFGGAGGAKSSKAPAYRVDLVLNESAYSNCSRISSGKNHQRRICRIGRARNAVMAYLETPAFADTEYLIVVDADMCLRWDSGSFAVAFATPPPWGAISANGVGQITPTGKENFLYIDTLAWMGMPNTTMGVHDLEGALGMHNKNPTYVRRHFNFDGPLVPVESAFGGVAIYRYSSVVGCRYSMGTSKARSRNGKQAYPCEHHTFNQCVRGPSFMHPGFVIEWVTPGAPKCEYSWSGPAPSYVNTDSVAETMKHHILQRRTFMIWPPVKPLPQFFLYPPEDAEEKHLAGARAAREISAREKEKSARDKAAARNKVLARARRDKSGIRGDGPQSDKNEERVVKRISSPWSRIARLANLRTP